jgi:hypothetical protein
MKLNFATRITVATASKSDSSNMFNSERTKVQALVNSAPVTIDRTVFSKTDAEKQELKNVKSHWKKLQSFK